MHHLARAGWDRDRGCLFIRCACGWEDAVFPSSATWYDSRMVMEEAEQIQRFKAHLVGKRSS
jgi:hypothetical protein